jgi:hypothetical protein
MPTHDFPTQFTERRRHPPGEVQDLFLTSSDVGDFLQRLVDGAVRTLGRDLSAAVAVVRDGGPAIGASSDTRASLSDAALFGWCDETALGAMQAGTVLLVDDLATDERFGAYRHLGCALAGGARSAMFLPLDGGPDAIGALNLYAGQSHAFDAARQSRAQEFALESSRALTLAVRRAHDLDVTDQLRAALTSRTTIDQGIGIIMGQNRCDASTAFAILRSASQHRNVKLRLVSAEIITAVSRKPPAAGHPFAG